MIGRWMAGFRLARSNQKRRETGAKAAIMKPVAYITTRQSRYFVMKISHLPPL
jgi:hypothetical protein